MTAPLILKRTSASRSSGQWRNDDYDVLSDGVVVGRIFRYHRDRSPTHGYEPPREEAMQAFARSWHREA